MKLAQDYRNIASLYLQNPSINKDTTSIEQYLKLFCETNPILSLKTVYGSQYLYEWKSPVMFLNGFTPCLIIEAVTNLNLGKKIDLKNKNILEKNAYGNFVLTENNILNKKSEIQLLGSF